MLEQPRDEMKLFRFIQTQAGVSRRKAIDLVVAGEVAVNHEAVIDPYVWLSHGAVQHLALRGHSLSLEPPEPRIYRLNKPAGMLCSHDDPFSGNTVGRLLRGEGFLGYTWAGRLDQDAEGLLLVSNDGGLIQALTHPRHEVRKVYRVWLSASPGERELGRALRTMEGGIEDEGERLCILSGRLEPRPPHVVVTLAEGKKHEVKRLFAHFGFVVRRLVRVAVGPVALGDLPAGEFERLPLAEEAALLDWARRLLAPIGGSLDRDVLADARKSVGEQGAGSDRGLLGHRLRPSGEPGDKSDANL